MTYPNIHHIVTQLLKKIGSTEDDVHRITVDIDYQSGGRGEIVIYRYATNEAGRHYLNRKGDDVKKLHPQKHRVISLPAREESA